MTDPRSLTCKQAIEMAQQALQKRDAPQARYWATLAIKKDRSSVDALLILAAVSRPFESKKYLEKVLQLDPANKKAAAGLEWVEQKMLEEPETVNVEHDTVSIPLEILQDSIKTSYRGLKKNKRRLQREQNGRKYHFRWQTLFSVLLCAFFIFVAIAAPQLAPPDDIENPSFYRQISRGISRQPEPPSLNAPLGTVDRHYDVFYSMVWGTRQSLKFGLSTAIVAAIIGTLIGTVSAYIGGHLDNIIMRITDAFLSFPIISAVALFVQLQSLLSPEQYGGILAFRGQGVTQMNLFQKIILNTDPIFLALVLFSWMPYARIIHTQVLEIKHTQYVDAAKVVGVRSWRIIWRHIIPNAISPIIVLATRDIGRMVVIQATFTYIGLGGDSAWATILSMGSKWIIGPGGSLFNHWWVYLPITLILVVFNISWNLLGDEINVRLNPQANGLKY